MDDEKQGTIGAAQSAVTDVTKTVINATVDLATGAVKAVKKRVGGRKTKKTVAPKTKKKTVAKKAKKVKKAAPKKAKKLKAKKRK
jgi:hypothetical protein